MTNNLTKKERGFVQDYVKTGNGTLAVKKNYDVSSDNSAGVIAYENLRKPKIKKAVKSIADQIPNSLLVKRHLEVLNKTEKIVTGAGKGYSIIEDTGQPHSDVVKALDIGYKLKKQYSDGKDTNLNINIIQGVEIKIRKDDREQSII